MQLCYYYTLKLNQIQIFLTYVYIQVSYFLNAVTKPPSYPLADKFFTLCSAKFLSLNYPAITLYHVFSSFTNASKNTPLNPSLSSLDFLSSAYSLLLKLPEIAL